MNLCFILIIIIVGLTGLLIVLWNKKVEIEKEYIADKELFLYNKCKISLIESYYKEFKEGVNPYTVLRKMSDTLKDYDS